MTPLRMFVIAALVLTWGSASNALRSPDRSALLAALDERSVTGLPGHLDHDEGQEMQEAVTAALAANPNDGEMASAAVRASFVLFPHVSPVISDTMPSIDLIGLDPLTLPWKVRADVTIVASVDGSGWRRVIDQAPCQSPIPIPIQKVFPSGASPGFHVVRFRATLRFDGGPAFLPTNDTRELSVLTYGIAGSSAAGQRVGALLKTAALANASDFDGRLPHVPLGAWLRTVAATPGSPPVDTTGEWCGERTEEYDERPTAICARTTVGSSPDGGHAEVWMRVATVDASGEKPTWTTVTPVMEGIDLIATGLRSIAELVTLPSALRSRVQDWPHASVAFDSQGITVSPTTPKPGEPVTIAIEVKNTGMFDLSRGINVVIADSPDGAPLARRQFVRTIPVGESVIVESDARFPRGYGVVSVVVWLSPHDVFAQPLLDEGWSASRVAWRVIRPDLAPPGFAEHMAFAVGCAPDCRRGR